MSRKMIFDKPMTKAQKDRRYKKKMQDWKDKNYLTFCFHLPKDLVTEFRNKTKENGDTQRQLLIEFITQYNNGINIKFLLEELEKYKRLYENEKSHIETTNLIIKKLSDLGINAMEKRIDD